MKPPLGALLNAPIVADFLDKGARRKPSAGGRGEDLLEVAKVALPGVASALIAMTDAIGRFVSLSLFRSKLLDTLFLLGLWAFCLYWLRKKVSIRSEVFPERLLFEYQYSDSRRLASKLALVLLPLFIGANLWRLTPNALKAYVDEDAGSLCGYICNASTGSSAITEGTISLWDEFGNRASDMERLGEGGFVCFSIRGASFTPRKARLQGADCGGGSEFEVDETYQENSTGCPTRTKEGDTGRVWVLACGK